ncbi:MAG: 4-hydroxy-3-methylbut-2-enyl diphosphate reductase [Anaeroplasmataceae bacterium]|nr:4-hydroxy-3-methylbut-2-enyl diphosphate reductase [Anaeroplasmataceae bacterium]
MKINKLSPQSYCSGVKNALQIAYEVLNREAKPIYLLGSIIHNQKVIADLESKGAILIEEKNTSRSELIKRIPGGTVILSAHGVAPIVYEIAKERGISLIDTTCGNVLLVQKRMKEYLAKGYDCFYIGTKGHPECEGILGISSSIQLIETQEDINKLKPTSNHIYVTNQTTLSIFETEKLYQQIKERFPFANIDNKICKATTLRQQACLEQEPVDLCIVVGDKSSSNTKKLVSASQSKGIKTCLVEDIEEVKIIDFSSIKSVSITSGASTPENLVDEIIEYLKRVD